MEEDEGFFLGKEEIKKLSKGPYHPKTGQATKNIYFTAIKLNKIGIKEGWKSSEFKEALWRWKRASDKEDKWIVEEIKFIQNAREAKKEEIKFILKVREAEKAKKV